ncbi:glycerol-3-phosphate dehydrogenase [Aurantiacibacter flavus]|uniref:Glycerol-3-phosphate dehydrogenase n=1 Tax=Aurantiacibacter flavus TaxID=3145232 RepID=A0ABV0D2I2_9SPHN
MSALYDLIVIGGGVNGAGVARDAAGRGAKVLLLEAGDLAGGTSSKSTKLIHGGLRYLEYAEFALVREALVERERLWAIAPHIVWPMRFVLPVSDGMRPRWMLRAGLFLYDHIGKREDLSATRTIRLKRDPAGKELLLGPTHGFEYSDCWVDDARLVVLNALDAARKGAEIRTREPVTSARRDADGQWQVVTEQGTYRARAVVNAGGPGADEVAGAMGRKPAFGLRRVRGSHIVVRRRFGHDRAYILQLPDTRICFAIPYEGEFTLIGTTDADHTGPLDNVEASEAEIAYLIEAFNANFADPIARADVVHSYAGVRALIDEGEDRPEAATRGYRLALSAKSEGAPVLGIYGGKITSYRHVAEEAVDMLGTRLDCLAKPAWTADAPLPGGDFPKLAQPILVRELQADYPFLSEAEALRIARAYGLDAVLWLGEAKTRADLGRDFGCGLSEAEVDYLHREEWAQTAEDILWRRTKLGLHMSAEQQADLREYLGA